MSELLRDNEVSKDRIEALAKQAFISSGRDNDGDLFLLEGGIKTFVTVDSDRKIITFFAVFGLRSNFGLEDKLKYVNKLNAEKILVRFYVPRPDLLWCDYQFLYEGGVTPFNIINSYKRFVSVCKGAIAEDESDMVGDD